MRLIFGRLFKIQLRTVLVLTLSTGFAVLLPDYLWADNADPGATGQVMPLKKLEVLGIKGDDNRVRVDISAYPWRMVGRLNHSGNHCTAVLVGPSAILTAAHCFWDKRRNRWSVPSAYHFVLGYDKGDIVAHSKIKSFTVAGGASTIKMQLRPELENDWAIAHLEKPLGKLYGFVKLTKINPRNLGNFIATGSTVVQGGYSRDIAHVLTVDTNCKVNRIQSSKSGALLVHQCDATKGDSGSPLFLQTGKDFTLLGIHVATLPHSSGKSDGIALSVDMFRAGVSATQK
ncbi:MAG: trypsin-like serine protease [Sneathiella sp.]